MWNLGDEMRNSGEMGSLRVIVDEFSTMSLYSNGYSSKRGLSCLKSDYVYLVHLYLGASSENSFPMKGTICDFLLVQ